MALLTKGVTDMCKRGGITHYRRNRPPVRHSVRLSKGGSIKIDGASWDDVMRNPSAWTFGHVDRGELLNYVMELAAAKRRWRNAYV